MKIKGYKFGHPVFGNRDYFDFDPELDVSCDFDNTNFYLNAENIDLGSNSTLFEMLSNGSAECIVEVYCTYTMFRKKYLVDINNIFVSIPLSDIRDRVECSLFIVASRDIYSYQNTSVIEPAIDLKFDIEKGDVLGLLGEYKFELDLKGTGLDSIIKIRPKVDSTDEGVAYLFQEESIILELNKDDFDKLKKYATSPDYQNILISSLLQPALIHACYKLQDEQFEEKSWCRAIKIRWEIVSKGKELPETSEIPAFVEQLLSYPTLTLLTTLGDLDSRQNNQEID